jgi:hypothetical protein
LEREALELEDENILLHHGDMLVFHTNPWQIPSILHEIGRQRKIAFRAAGEGSKNALDLDMYDEHYQHIFLWNRAQKEVVGAYRIGRTDVILRKSGVEGLYVQTLFRLRPKYLQNFGPALELGRSFVRPEYQRDNRYRQLQTV